MKNQNDLIFSIVFVVLGLIAGGIAFGTKPEPPTIPAPPVVDVSDAKLPATSVVYGDALPGGGTGSGGAGGARGGFPGGPPGMFGGSGSRGGYPGGPPGGFGGSSRGGYPGGPSGGFGSGGK